MFINSKATNLADSYNEYALWCQLSLNKYDSEN